MGSDWRRVRECGPLWGWPALWLDDPWGQFHAGNLNRKFDRIVHIRGGGNEF
ncbi:MAG: hypothetical protein RJB11_2051 [Planctomycetota bacterium]